MFGDQQSLFCVLHKKASHTGLEIELNDESI